MRALPAVTFVLLGLVAGCGGPSRRTLAADAVTDARTALADLDAETAGAEVPAEVADALDRANVRLVETEHALDLWGGATGSLAYERMAACLSAALSTLRDALIGASMPVSVELESAEAALGMTTERECGHERGGD